jgi:transcriptional regulator with XRE-family HTH domain
MATRRKDIRKRAGTRASTPGNRAKHHLDLIGSAIRSDRAVADLLGVAPSQLTRWRRGQAPGAENAFRLAGLSFVIESLLGWLEPSVIPSWLNGINAHLGDRSPAYMLREGELLEVIGAIEAEKAGVFA